MAGLSPGIRPLHNHLQPLQSLGRQGIWFAVFEALTGKTGIVGSVAIDSSHIVNRPAILTPVLPHLRV